MLRKHTHVVHPHIFTTAAVFLLHVTPRSMHAYFRVHTSGVGCWLVSHRRSSVVGVISWEPGSKRLCNTCRCPWGSHTPYLQMLRREKGRLSMARALQHDAAVHAHSVRWKVVAMSHIYVSHIYVSPIYIYIYGSARHPHTPLHHSECWKTWRTSFQLRLATRHHVSPACVLNMFGIHTVIVHVQQLYICMHIAVVHGYHTSFILEAHGPHQGWPPPWQRATASLLQGTHAAGNHPTSRGSGAYPAGQHHHHHRSPHPQHRVHHSWQDL